MSEAGLTVVRDAPAVRSRRGPVVTFFAPSLGHMTETMAYLLAHDDACSVRVVTRTDSDERSEHPWCLNRLRSHGGIEIVDLRLAAQPSEMLLFPSCRQGSRCRRSCRPGRQLARNAAFLPATWEISSLGDRLRELVRSFPHYLGARFAVFSGRRPLSGRWQFLLQRPVFYAPFIHPHFLTNVDWLAAATVPVSSQARRRFRVGFLGNRQPPERVGQLAQCHQALVDASVSIVGADLEPSSGQSAVWIVYGDGGDTKGLDPRQYMAVLSDMDLCISPPGWGRNWTHRTVEALVRGAIPVLEDPDLYDVGLKDGETCMLVRNGDWAEATRRALAIADDEIVAMRRAVLELSRRTLTIERMATRLCSQLFSQTVDRLPNARLRRATPLQEQENYSVGVFP